MTEIKKLLEQVICVVDDDEAVRDSVVALLEICGFSTTAYSSAEAFLDQCLGKVYCLLLDVEMPGMTGPELVDKLSQEGSLPPTILVTAHSDHYSAQDALAKGAHVVLAKPANEEDLLAAIESATAAHT